MPISLSSTGHGLRLLWRYPCQREESSNLRDFSGFIGVVTRWTLPISWQSAVVGSSNLAINDKI